METNFKVDVPSFALGYSAGVKKVPPSQEKEVTIKSNGKTEILPDEKQLLSKVTVNTNVELGFNIAYGTEPPEDTSKLWVKTEQPASNVIVSMDEVWEDGDRPEANEWMTSLAFSDLPGTAKVGDCLYAITNSVKKYDIQNAKSTQYSLMSSARYGPSCAAVGTKIYVFGGSSTTTGSSPSTYVYIYETETDTGTLLEGVKFYAYSGNRGGSLSGCVANGTDIYLLGGRYNNTSAGISNRLQVFDTVTQTFTTKTSLPMNLCGMACALVDGYIYYFGGQSSNFNGSNYIYRYSIEEDRHEREGTSLPYKMDRLSACVWGRRIYLFGGRNGTSANDPKYGTILYYDLDTGEVVKCEATIVNINDVALETSTGGAYIHGDAIYVVLDNDCINRYEPQIGDAVLEQNALQIIPNKPENVFPVLKAGTTRVEVSAGKVRMGDEENKAKNVNAALYKEGEWQDI
jgi:hypothetical protein